MAQPSLLDNRNGRFIAFGFLYISEGIPYGFATTAIVMFMRLEELSIKHITNGYNNLLETSLLRLTPDSAAFITSIL